MNKVKLEQALLLIFWCTVWMCSCQEQTPHGVIPIGNLSRDNPNHKRIYEWLDNYRQKVSEMPVYESRDPLISDKQDLVDPQSYSSINDAIKLASNQPQPQNQAIDARTLPNNFEDILRAVPRQQNDIQSQLNKRALGNFLPAAFNQANDQNGQVAPPSITLPPSQQTQPISLSPSQLGQQFQFPPSPQPDLHALYAQRTPEERISRIEKLDPFIQEHIRKLTQASPHDGRSVIVEVKGDDTSDKSLFEQLRPILHDPSVLDQLKPSLQESRSLLNNKNNQQISYEPLVVAHKTSDLRMDKPLLEQKERIDKLRDLLIQQQLQQNPSQAIPWAQISQPQQYSHPNQLSDQKQPQFLQNVNQRALIQQLEALAVRPIVGQLQQPGSSQTQSSLPQNALLIPQSPYNLGKPEQLVQLQSAPQQPEPKLLGQRQRQPLTNAQPLKFEQHFTMNGVTWQGDQRTSTSEPVGPDTRQKRQPDQYDLNGNYNDDQQRISPAEDAARKRQFREQLLKDMEEQEHKRQELINIDSQHREMIAEERRKQEIRDQQDAERRAHEKQAQLNKDQKNKQNSNGQLSRTAPTQPPKVNSRNAVNDNRWSSQEWPQPPPEPQPQIKPQQEHRPQPQQERHSRPQPQQQQPQYRPQPRPQPKPQPLPQPMPQIEYQPQPQFQYQPQPQIQYQPLPQIQYQPQSQRQEVQSQALTSPLARPYEVLQSIPSSQESPESHIIRLPPQVITSGQSDNKWVSVQAALNQLQEIENQNLQNAKRAPIQVSASALAQAEQSDAEYIKLLREILLSQTPQTQTQSQVDRTVSYVPVEAPPTGGQMTTTLPSGQVIGGSENNWWRGEQSRQRADPKVRQ